MRVETNWRLVRRNRRLANVLFFFSMGVLLVGFFVANTQLTSVKSDDPSLILTLFLPWLVLPVGLISTLVSVRMTNLWIRRPRPEDVIQEGLKGINKRSVLYNYFHFPARHVLVMPTGVFAFVTRYQDGFYINRGDQWFSPGGPMRWLLRFFRRDDVGNPTEEALRAARHVQQMLKSSGQEITVQPLILFVDPRARLQLEDPAVPVLFADNRLKPNLRDYLRDHMQAVQKLQDQDTRRSAKVKTGRASGRAEVISPEDVAEVLDQVVAPVSG